MKKTIAFITALLVTASYGNAVFAAENDSPAETEVSQTEAVSEEKDEASEGQNGGSDETGNGSEEETVQTEPDKQPGEITESTEESEPENNDESVNDGNTDEGETEAHPSEEEKFTEEEFIKRIYRIALEREADEGGLATWKGHLDSGRMTAADVVRCIVSSNEYSKKEKTDEEFVQMIWILMTDSEYSDEAAAQMTGRLAAGYSRTEIQRVLESSRSFTELCSRYGIERSGRYVHDDLKKFAGFLTEGEYEQEMLVWKLQDKNISAAELLEDYYTRKTYPFDEEGIREYVSDMYTTVLVRDEVPESGLEHWSRYLRYGMSSRFVLRGFVMSEEFRSKCSLWGINSGVITVNENRDMNAGVTEFVQRIYNICLGRRADVNGLNTWTGHINSGRMTASDVVKSIVFSSEYKSHNSSDEEYAGMLFRLMRDTEASDTEVSEFVSETLAKGYTRESVLRKFGLSEEFTRMCADFGIERGEIKVGGWSRNNGGFKCYISPETGLMATGDQMLGDIHCFFDNEGSLRTDWSDLKTFVDTSDTLYSYNSMVEDITGLQQQYSSLVSVSVIGSTADGRQIYDMMIGSSDAKRQIVIQAGCHAREYMTSQVLMANAERFLKNYWSGSYAGKSYSELLDSYCIHIIPMLNPDGITLSQYGINGINNPSVKARIRNIYNKDLREGVTSRSFDSYLRSWKCNALGVDLNRNFDSDWAGQNMIKRPSCAGYAGPSAASESEVKALSGLVESLNDVQAVISYHSSGSCVYWAYGQTGEFRNVCNRMASDLGSLTGYYLINGDDRGGGCSNWVAGKGLRAATLEIGSGDSPLPLSQLSDICERHKNVIPYLLSMPLYNAKEIQHKNNAAEYVRHLYNTILSREPDENGWKFWIERINNGKSTPADEIRLFTESTEFMNHGYSDEEFIGIAYEAFCRRSPSDEEISQNLSSLGEGYTRSWILSRLAHSDEFRAMCEEYSISGGEVTVRN